MSVEDISRHVEMEEDYDDGDSEDEGGDVQLGFIDATAKNELFRDSDWRNWDGGKVGGHPVRPLFILTVVERRYPQCVIVTNACIILLASAMFLLKGLAESRGCSSNMLLAMHTLRGSFAVSVAGICFSSVLWGCIGAKYVLCHRFTALSTKWPTRSTGLSTCFVASGKIV